MRRIKALHLVGESLERVADFVGGDVGIAGYVDVGGQVELVAEFPGGDALVALEGVYYCPGVGVGEFAGLAGRISPGREFLLIIGGKAVYLPEYGRNQEDVVLVAKGREFFKVGKEGVRGVRSSVPRSENLRASS